MENALLKKSVGHKLLRIIQVMVAIEPVLANIIAISLGLAVLLLLSFPVLFPTLGKYHLYLTYVIYALITFQTIKSSTKSLFIPFIAMSFAAHVINPDWHLLNIEFLKQLMLLGVIGIGTAIFVIK
jgi:hypothetical protein